MSRNIYCVRSGLQCVSHFFETKRTFWKILRKICCKTAFSVNKLLIYQISRIKLETENFGHPRKDRISNFMLKPEFKKWNFNTTETFYMIQNQYDDLSTLYFYWNMLDGHFFKNWDMDEPFKTLFSQTNLTVTR